MGQRERYNAGFHEIVKTLDTTGFEQITAASQGRSFSPKKRKVAEALPPIAGAKRFCRSLHYQTDQMPAPTDTSEGQIDEERTPDLSSDDGTSVQLHRTPISCGRSTLNLVEGSVDRPIGPKEPVLLAKPNRTYFIG